MAKLVTVVQTYFSDGTYRNNRVEIEIPIEAAGFIAEYWKEKGVHNCTKAKFLALNQSATVELFQDETCIGGMSGINIEEQDETETFEHSFVDDEEDDRD